MCVCVSACDSCGEEALLYFFKEITQKNNEHNFRDCRKNLLVWQKWRIFVFILVLYGNTLMIIYIFLAISFEDKIIF